MTALEFAIQMELDGEKYYLEQAEKNKDNNLYTVFKILADEERVHAEILEKHAKEIEYEMDESAAYTEFQNVFVSLDDFNVETKAAPDQLDGYRLALQKEQESIDLYEKMLAEAKRDEDRVLFEFLVEQEKIHYQVFDDITQHLIKAEQWVEDAEFGRRMEEY